MFADASVYHLVQRYFMKLLTLTAKLHIFRALIEVSVKEKIMTLDVVF